MNRFLQLLDFCAGGAVLINLLWAAAMRLNPVLLPVVVAAEVDAARKSRAPPRDAERNMISNGE
jgi:hypothetical protein